MRSLHRMIPALFSLALAAQDYQPGQRVEALWKEQWWPAKVLQVQEGRFRITYDGFDGTWDEWAEARRLRPLWNSGDRIEVKWRGQWYKAQVLETRRPSYRVHYEGFSAAEDEWVDALNTRSRQ